MIKHFTLKESKQINPDNSQKTAQGSMIQPSGLTMKFVLGYAASMEVYSTKMLGTLRVLLN
jgi:hypothetical protein